ncbi:MAG: hypothetical protein IT290_08880 [Deltaproteobacteria bacterium]|nr:hypothetical protein [Deltaproteobacteria bacterium]
MHFFPAAKLISEASASSGLSRVFNGLQAASALAPAPSSHLLPLSASRDEEKVHNTL